ncbi:MAG: hypothetical protein A3A08_01670 [Candidatus Nealsonbacteria bacterium RIFCSPLOWO2_01_FULL_41_9]|uniref:HEPN AbiU2-like domain-containing protein n=1 Tax=Candidatus Nealsonbacteria bacterium RIFCSPLOWO2_01_FULL_41_9 TaxID=1801671 RepID=A0A1G2EDE6_9BACT|nr:MAG: hypothetical protein A3A08_01670 [Candidatus Nealsonbacteria bacterium RIFCSPLOWO2_01_FULL_41_9]
MKKDKDFDILVDKILFGYEQFCLNKILHEKVTHPYYSSFKGVWDRILISLEIGFWLELAKTFEKPNENFNKTLSIYYLPNICFKGYIRKIDKIRKLRNKAISHNDLRTLRNWQKFLAKLGLKRDDAEKIFERTIEVLDKFCTTYIDSNKSLKLRFDTIKSDIQISTEHFIKYSDRNAPIE